ncbi:hypothetical protein N7517_003958 [Penicillium concentricum]|uniref:Transaldolase n=1 Tax=Penicillium concentricum TaxID=293559 RepID=A0A9W9V7S8_9EURO|nr:uncharacterized protein N7517_003958 [Penicillium concentricum]KAJ5371952.1 hypothetical protein N7517_003958 [Penicillium concentricum]
MSDRTLLERLEKLCNVDVDDVDTALITSLPFKPHNLTSNQQVICNTMLADSNRELLARMAEMYGNEGWEAVFDRMAVQLVNNNLEHIKGRVLLQISPRHINNKDAIIQHCHRLAKCFQEASIPNDRFAIKLPFTGAAACAAAELNRDGIRTLATSVFGLEQAIAASQSGCLFISPYYNEIAAYSDLSLWTDTPDPALEHPMSARVIQILEAYAKFYSKTGKEQPIMVIASNLNPIEVMAMAELGCQHVTITGGNMKALLETPDSLPPVTTSKPTHPYAGLTTAERLKCLSRVDSLSPAGWRDILALGATDYLANNGSALDQAIKADGFVAKGIQDAMDWFIEAEEIAKEAIEREILLKKESVGVH